MTERNGSDLIFTSFNYFSCILAGEDENEMENKKQKQQAKSKPFSV
jgi:hypothetical protein